ncbi:MAG: transposase, partial [Deltaproteobacteria bacterium]|nr:transposase [Deltaproteobacteria bacterium]
ARRTAQDEAWWKAYRLRSGVEGSIKRLKDLVCPNGRVRFRGLAKVTHWFKVGVHGENFRRVVIHKKNLNRARKRKSP